MSARNDKLAAALRDYWEDDARPDDTARFRAILARHGLAVLPVEPTFAMQRALMLHDPAALLTARESVEAITRYRAMLAAAKEDSADDR